MASSELQQQSQARLAVIRRLVHDQPALAARVIREWLTNDSRATTANTATAIAGAPEPRPLRPASAKLLP